MSKGQNIIVTAQPQGKFLEGVMSGTPSPGMCGEIVPSVAPISGRHSWRVRSLTAGSKGQVAIFREDDLQGFLGLGAYRSFPSDITGGPSSPRAPGTAYVSGTRGFLYDPIMGEELNIYIKDIAGTADDVAIGDLFGAAADGTWHSNSSYTSAPMQSMEQIFNPNADYMLWVTYLGNNA
jgi:hypothetical protein